MTMNSRDRELGMHADITRRDFLGGVGLSIGATLVPQSANVVEASVQEMANYYPPALTGMRASHVGSFEVAHALRDGATWTGESTGESYDLVPRFRNNMA